jgi:hypothetical protein
MGDPTWKITKIALNSLGAWLDIQIPMSMVKYVWQSLLGQSKTGKNGVLGILSQTSATGGQLGECSGVDMWGGVDVCLEQPQGSPCLIQCSRLVNEQGVQSTMFLSSVLTMSPPWLRIKQRKMDSILLYSIDNDQIALGKRKDNKKKNNKNTIP